MALVVSAEHLTDDTKRKILASSFQPNPDFTAREMGWIHPYETRTDIASQKTRALLPLAFGVSLGFAPPPTRDYPVAETVQFQGQLRETQKQIKSQTIAQLNEHKACVLSLHVGWGKSYFSVWLIAKLKLKALIVVNRIVLAKQWLELVRQTCPTASAAILEPKRFSGGLPNGLPDIGIVNITNLSKFPHLECYGTLICDEVHLLVSKNLFRNLFCVAPRYAIGLSATPTRDDGLGRLIDLFFGGNRIEAKLERRHFVKIVQTGITLEFTRGYDGGMDWNSILNSQAEHVGRNRLIARLVEEHPDRNFLILVKRISHGQALMRLLDEKAVSNTNLLGTGTSFDRDARVLVATTSKVGVGFSHPKLDALIVASDIEAYFIQHLGRVFRTETVEPLVFDLVDANSVMKKHFATRKKVYQEIGAVFETMTMK